MTLDRDRIAQRLEAIRRLLKDWEEASSETTVDTLREDRKTCLFLCYVMESAIQTALDLSNHLIANLDLPRPSSYRETFRVLGSRGWLPSGLSRRLEELAAFRNVLAHNYHGLDFIKLLPHVKRSWRTLREFSVLVARKTAGRKRR